MLKTHQQICSAILEEEDEIVECHRRQIDETMKLVKEVQIYHLFNLIILTFIFYEKQKNN